MDILYIYKSELLDIELMALRLFGIVGLFVCPEVSGCAYIACSSQKCSQGKSKLTQSKSTFGKDITIAQPPISNVEGSNIGSAY